MLLWSQCIKICNNVVTPRKAGHSLIRLSHILSEAGLMLPHAERSKPDGRERGFVSLSGLKGICSSPTCEDHSWRFVALP